MYNSDAAVNNSAGFTSSGQKINPNPNPTLINYQSTPTQPTGTSYSNQFLRDLGLDNYVVIIFEKFLKKSAWKLCKPI